MRYVLDSSVAFKWVVPEADSAKARQLRDDFLKGVHELLAPDVFPFEIAAWFTGPGVRVTVACVCGAQCNLFSCCTERTCACVRCAGCRHPCYPTGNHAEIAHALTRAERQGRITVGQALSLWMTVMTSAPGILPGLPLAQRAIEISSAVRIGVYDCLYVALAEREGCQMVTADARLIRNLRARFPFVIELAAVP
jgi:predicted nucleic acid-binding protein